MQAIHLTAAVINSKSLGKFCPGARKRVKSRRLAWQSGQHVRERDELANEAPCREGEGNELNQPAGVAYTRAHSSSYIGVLVSQAGELAAKRMTRFKPRLVLHWLIFNNFQGPFYEFERKVLLENFRILENSKIIFVAVKTSGKIDVFYDSLKNWAK